MSGPLRYSIVFWIVSLLSAEAQNTVDINQLSSTSGKRWNIIVNPDDNTLKEHEKDDYLIIYSNGRCEYHEGMKKATIAESIALTSNEQTKLLPQQRLPQGWFFNKQNNTITFNFTMDDGRVSVIRAEILTLTEDLLSLNFDKDGEILLRHFSVH